MRGAFVVLRVVTRQAGRIVAEICRARRRLSDRFGLGALAASRLLLWSLFCDQHNRRNKQEDEHTRGPRKPAHTTCESHGTAPRDLLATDEQSDAPESQGYRIVGDMPDSRQASRSNSI
jgi:hypothetical protein